MDLLCVHEFCGRCRNGMVVAVMGRGVVLVVLVDMLSLVVLV